VNRKRFSSRLLARVRKPFTLHWSGPGPYGVMIHFNADKWKWTKRLWARRHERQQLLDSALFM
jgi:hypothetical protein